jgi:hypothetical protein
MGGRGCCLELQLGDGNRVRKYIVALREGWFFLLARKSPRLPLATNPAVTILLCTLNGERFLAEQLASLEGQTFKNWKLIASDDGVLGRDQIYSACLPEILSAWQG